MKETPIIFNTDMVRAILDGRKTQTRRVMKPQPVPIPDDVPTYHGEKYWWSSREFRSMVRLPDDIGCMPSQCPYGQVGDLLWVRQNWWVVERAGQGIGRQFVVFDDEFTGDVPDDTAPLRPCQTSQRWGHHPSIFMPKAIARIWLEITGIRVEKSKDITLEDAIAEGFGDEHEFNETFLRLNPKLKSESPWVWVIEFKK